MRFGTAYTVNHQRSVVTTEATIETEHSNDDGRQTTTKHVTVDALEQHLGDNEVVA